MKNILKCIIFALATIFVSCTDKFIPLLDGDGNPVKATGLIVSESTLTFDSDGGYKTITISIDSPWQGHHQNVSREITPSEDWIGYYDNNIDGIFYIDICVDPNNTSDERYGEVTISFPELDLTTTIEIIQEKEKPEPEPEPEPGPTPDDDPDDYENLVVEYLTNNNEKIWFSDNWGAKIVSHTFSYDEELEEWYGIVKFASAPTQVPEYEFSNNNNLFAIYLPKSITKIEQKAFYCCENLVQVAGGLGVEEIGYDAFSECHSLSYMETIGNTESNLKIIGNYAFNVCRNLVEVVIPAGVISIGNEAFHDCSSLDYVFCLPSTPPQGDSYMFSGNAAYRIIYVWNSSLNAYKNANHWSTYASDIFGTEFFE